MVSPFRYKEYDCLDTPLEDLREEASDTFGVPNVESMSGKELCSILDERVDQLNNDKNCYNQDEESIDGTLMSQIPEYLKYSVVAENNKTYCYHLVDLYKEIQNNAKRDHFNRFLFTPELKEQITTRYKLLQRILTTTAAADVFTDEINDVSSKQTKNVNQPLIDLWTKLYYPGLTIEEFRTLTPKQYQAFLQKLSIHGLSATKEEKLDRKVLINALLQEDSSEYYLGFELATRSYATKFRSEQRLDLSLKVSVFYEQLISYMDSFLAISQEDIMNLSVNSLVKLYHHMNLKMPGENTQVSLLRELIVKIDETNAMKFVEWMNIKFDVSHYWTELSEWLGDYEEALGIIEKQIKDVESLDDLLGGLPFPSEVGKFGDLVTHLIKEEDPENVALQLYQRP
ncbi:MAG: hypothetical protein EOO38_04545 [Cytophagaceae bacterium]|nr:MAG: hypothetical protein EOO38_04545 [Cytophagaceae bacterium]